MHTLIFQCLRERNYKIVDALKQSEKLAEQSTQLKLNLDAKTTDMNVLSEELERIKLENTVSLLHEKLACPIFIICTESGAESQLGVRLLCALKCSVFHGSIRLRHRH